MTSPNDVQELECDAGSYQEEDYRNSLKVIRNVLLDRDYLYQSVAKNYLGETLTQENGEAFAVDVERALKLVRSVSAIRATIQYHTGEVLTEKLLTKICWQLSANEESLVHGKYLSPRLADYSGHWMLVDIAGVDADPRGSNAYATIVIRSLAGRAAGWSMRQDITKPHAYFIAGQLGFRGGYRNEWYQFDGDPIKLYGLYFAALLDGERIARFACSEPLWGVNRKIIRMRHRADMNEDGLVLDNWGNPVDSSKLPFGCPLRLTHECLDCPRKRHLVIKTDGHKPTAETCGAAY